MAGLGRIDRDKISVIFNIILIYPTRFIHFNKEQEIRQMQMSC